MDKPPAAFGDLQLVHAADNRSGQLMWYIKRSVLFVIDTAVSVSMGDLILQRTPTERGVGTGRMAGAAVTMIVTMLATLQITVPAIGQQAYQESVRLRPRLDYESFGFSFRALLGDRDRAGPRKPADQFVVYSRLETGTGYRANVLRTPDGARGSGFVKIKPVVAVRSDWDRHDVNFLFQADSEAFVSESDENKVDLKGRINGNYAFTFDRVASWQAELGRVQAVRGSGDDAGSAFEPQIINSYGIGLGYSDGTRQQIALAANAKFIHYDYEKVNGVSRDLLDYDEIKLGGTAALYSDGPLQLFVAPNLEMIKYDQDINSDSTTYDLALAWRYDASALTATDGRIGVTRRVFDQSSEETIDSLLLKANVLWNATPLITLSGELFSATSDTQKEAGIGSVTTGGQIVADYELLENLVFTSSFRYINDRFTGITRTDETFRYRFAAKYLIGEHYFIRADLGYESRKSDNALEEYDDATILFRFGMKACCLTDTGLVSAFGEGVRNVFR